MKTVLNLRKFIILVGAVLVTPGHPVAFVGGVLLTMRYGISHTSGDIAYFHRYALIGFAIAVGSLRWLLFWAQLVVRVPFWEFTEAFVRANLFSLLGLAPLGLLELMGGFQDMIFMFLVLPIFIGAALLIIPISWRRSRNKIKILNAKYTPLSCT